MTFKKGDITRLKTDYGGHFKKGDTYIIERGPIGWGVGGNYYDKEGRLVLGDYLERDEPRYKQYLGKKYAVHCKTQEEWDRVLQAIEDAGVTGCNGKKPTSIGDTKWTDKGRDSLLCLANKYKQPFCSWMGRTEIYDMNDYKIISVAEFFGEEEPRGLEPTHITIDEASHVPDITEWYYKEQPINKLNIIKKTMNKIQQALRTKEQKAFEKYGFGTPEVLNEAGREAYIDYVYETGDTTKAGFQAKVVELYKEDTAK